MSLAQGGGKLTLMVLDAQGSGLRVSVSTIVNRSWESVATAGLISATPGLVYWLGLEVC